MYVIGEVLERIPPIFFSEALLKNPRSKVSRFGRIYKVKSIKARTLDVLETDREHDKPEEIQNCDRRSDSHEVPETDKEHDKPEAIQSCDRISDLHDSILHHMFSFLPTKHIVQASILSKRWQKLWESSPYLDFEASEGNDKERFMNFVDNVMLLRDNSSIIKFQLSIKTSCDDHHINKWIRAAVRAGVRELDLYIRFIEIRSLHSLSTWHSLVALKLDFGIWVRFPKTFCFPMLKRMHLRKITVSENFAQQLIKSPKLETLFLELCQVEIRSSPSSITLEDLIMDDSSSKILPNLDHLFISLNFYGPAEGGFCLHQFIRKLYNAKVLQLSHHSVMLLQSNMYFLYHLPTFCNLKSLELTIGIQDNDVQVMASLLQCSPLLESLQIRFLIFYLQLWLYERKVMQEQFPSLSTPPRLKHIRMDDFRGSRSQVELVRFFLGNAQVLEKIVVQLDYYVQDPDNLLAKELEQIPRLSTNCILEYRTSNKNYSLL